MKNTHFFSSCGRAATIRTLCAIFFFSFLFLRSHAQMGTVTTVAGNSYYYYSSPSFAGEGGPATSTSVKMGRNISSIAVDTAGDVFFSDNDNFRIRKVNHSTGILTTIGGDGTWGGFSYDGSLAGTGPIGRVSQLTSDRMGNIYFYDTANGTIRRIDYSTGRLSTICNSRWPVGAIALDTLGNLFFLDFNCLKKKSVSGSVIEVAGATDSLGFAGDGGPASAARFNRPASLAIDKFGNLYVGDVGNKRIRKIDTMGIISTIAGTSTPAMRQTGCPATSVSIEASHIYVDTSLNVLLSGAAGENYGTSRIDTLPPVLSIILVTMFFNVGPRMPLIFTEITQYKS